MGSPFDNAVNERRPRDRFLAWNGPCRGGKAMSILASTAKLLTAGVRTGFACAALTAGAVAQQKVSPPDFSSGNAGWLTFNVDFSIVPGGSSPIRNDPGHPRVSNQEAATTGKQPAYFIADLSNNTILKPWVVERMKKDNAEVLAGKIAFTPHSSCTHAGVPGFHLYGFQPLYFVQTPKEIVMIYSNDQQVRRVYLDVPHSANPKSSWYGESVGRYEGDTLVVDTIGLNDKTFIDNYRTPHTEKLHVVERYRLIDGGKTLQVTFRVEDPDTFYQPWSAIGKLRRVQMPMHEEACAENNQNLFDYHIPVASKPDF